MLKGIDFIHEFFKFENDQIVEVQAIWDIPELMVLSKTWPMAPQLGAFVCTPGPMTGDGLDIKKTKGGGMAVVKNMLSDLCRHPANPDPKVMNLEKYWHERFNWYGPTGIGACRGISGFRNWHQIPFLRGLPNRILDETSDKNSSWKANTHWIAEGHYVCETGWPNMKMNLSGDGWMGIAPVEKEILIRSLDFWRLEGNLIRENWVLVDILDVYRQIGVDVFARLIELNKARPLVDIKLSRELC